MYDVPLDTPKIVKLQYPESAQNRFLHIATDKPAYVTVEYGSRKGIEFGLIGALTKRKKFSIASAEHTFDLSDVAVGEKYMAEILVSPNSDATPYDPQGVAYVYRIYFKVQ